MKATSATEVHIFPPRIEKHVRKPPHADEDAFVP